MQIVRVVIVRVILVGVLCVIIVVLIGHDEVLVIYVAIFVVIFCNWRCTLYRRGFRCSGVQVFRCSGVQGFGFRVSGLGLRVNGAHGAREALGAKKFQVYDDVPPTHVSHNIMKQRLGEDATACCYSEKMEKKGECKKQNGKIKKK